MNDITGAEGDQSFEGILVSIIYKYLYAVTV